MKTIIVLIAFYLQFLGAILAQTPTTYEITDMKLFLSKGGRTEEMIAADAKKIDIRVYNKLFTNGKLNSGYIFLMITTDKDEYYKELGLIKKYIDAKGYNDGLKQIKYAQDLFNLLDNNLTIKDLYIERYGGIKGYNEFKNNIIQEKYYISFVRGVPYRVYKEDLKAPDKAELVKNIKYVKK